MKLEVYSFCKNDSVIFEGGFVPRSDGDNGFDNEINKK
jgi:hypothetical protein